jgi:hypothetical protein
MEDFILDSVFTTKEGARYIATHKDVDVNEIWEDCIEDYVKWESVEYLGISLMPERYSKYMPECYLIPEVQFIDGDLFMQGRIVEDYKYYCEHFYSSLTNEVPRLYQIRQRLKNAEYSSFVCGFDLLSNGETWVGLNSKTYGSISEAFDFLKQELGNDFKICLEEPLRIYLD